MPTATELKIHATRLCEPLDEVSWYDLTNGPRLRLSDPLRLSDGTVELNASIPLQGGALLARTEAMLSGRFHGKCDRMFLRVAEPADHIISADAFVESLLGPAKRMDWALRELTESETGTAWTMAAEEDLLEIIDGIRDGKLDHAAFARRIAEADYGAGTAGHHLLFARNSHILTEQLRTALLRAFDHGDRMMQYTRLLLRNDDGQYFSPLAPGEEINHASRAAERLHGAFADGIGVIATALDILYRLFVYVVREPFGSAELPGRLYFPYNENGRAYTPYPKGATVSVMDVGPADLPHALPNLAPGSFFGLRPMRNALAHNMMSGHIQPSCFIGCGTSLVGGIPVRYVQAVAPDLDDDGKPFSHAYVGRFYRQQRDAAAALRDLLEGLALTADHSLRWLAERLERRARGKRPAAGS